MYINFYPWTTISWMFYFCSDWINPGKKNVGSYIQVARPIFSKVGKYHSNNFVDENIREFSTVSSKIIVFWILLWLKSHGEQFSQVERSAFRKMLEKCCTEEVDHLWPKSLGRATSQKIWYFGSHLFTCVSLIVMNGENA